MAPADSISHQLYVTSLWRLSAALNATLDLERVLQAAEDLIVAYTGADVGYIMLLDDGGQLTAHSSQLAAHDTGNGGAAVDEPASILQRALGGEAVIATEVDGMEFPDRRNGYSEPRAASREPHSVLCVPLTARGKVTGAIYLEGRMRFDLMHRELVSAFANHAAVAIENARLYGRLRDDFQERLRLEREIAEEKQRQAMLEQAAQARFDLLNAVAHDLKNPLWVIQGCAENLAERGESRWDAVRRGETYETIGAQADRLLALVGNLLDMARQEAGKALGLDRQPIEIEALLRRFERIARFYPGFTEQHRVVVTVADALPTIDADERKLLQILDNLVSNAIKYSPRGGQITLAAAVHDGELRVSVSDEGEGITPEQKSLLFQPYGTVDRDGRPWRGGTGLGLYLTLRLVELHGGHIDVESTPGKGSRFTFSLPLVP